MFKKAYMILVVLLWVATGAVLIMQFNHEDESAVAQTFNQINCNYMTSNFHANGKLDSEYLTANEQQELLEEVANDIGLNSEYEILRTTEGGKRVVSLEKTAQNADVTMKIITNEVEVEDNVFQAKQTFVMDLNLYKYINEIVILKKNIEQTLNNSPFNCQYTMDFEAQFPGKLSLADKNRLSKWLLDEINANSIHGSKTEDLYTLYAYTDYIGEYEIVDNKAVNVNIAFNYNEEENITKLYMATPFINNDY